MKLEKGIIIIYLGIIRVVVSYEEGYLFSCSLEEYVATELFDCGYSRSCSGYDKVENLDEIEVIGNISLKNYGAAARD